MSEDMTPHLLSPATRSVRIVSTLFLLGILLASASEVHAQVRLEERVDLERGDESEPEVILSPKLARAIAYTPDSTLVSPVTGPMTLYYWQAAKGGEPIGGSMTVSIESEGGIRQVSDNLGSKLTQHEYQSFGPCHNGERYYDEYKYDPVTEMYHFDPDGPRDILHYIATLDLGRVMAGDKIRLHVNDGREDLHIRYDTDYESEWGPVFVNQHNLGHGVWINFGLPIDPEDVGWCGYEEAYLEVALAVRPEIDTLDMYLGYPTMELMHGDSAYVEVMPLSKSVGAVEIPNDFTVDVILEGDAARFGDLAGPGGVRGDRLSNLPVSAFTEQSVWFHADGAFEPDMAFTPHKVGIRAEKSGAPDIYSTDSLLLGGHQFIIRADPDTALAGEEAVLTIIAVDADSNEVVLPNATEIYVSVYEGTLIGPDSTVSTYLEDVRYEDARAGRVRYLPPASLGGASELLEFVYVEEYPEDWSYYYSGYLDYSIVESYFAVTASPDSVAQSDTSHVTVIARDRNQPGFEGNFQVRLSLEEAGGGHFIRQQWHDASHAWLELDKGSELAASYAALDSTYIPAGEASVRERVVLVAAELPPVLAAASMDVAVSTATDKLTIRAVHTGDRLKLGKGVLQVQQESAIEILLGETKYFYAARVDGKLVIKENSSDPDMGCGDCMPDVSWEVLPIAGEKLGVYWDDLHYTEWSVQGRQLIPVSTRLAPGLIRITGRFWKVSISYEVDLVARHSGSEARMRILVSRPNRLGDVDAEYTDALGQMFNLDDIVIRFAGEYGIPPQFLKGLMQQESSHQSAYRYEPYADALAQKQPEIRHRMLNNPYRVASASDVGAPGIPMSHNVTNGGPYRGYAGTIYDFYKKSRDSDLKIAGYRTLRNKYGELYTTAEKEIVNSGTSANEVGARAKALALSRLDQWVHSEYNGGLGNYVAQTRIYASYGLMQLLYYDAFTSIGYPVDVSHLPETLNEGEMVIPYAIRLFINRKFNSSSAKIDIDFSASERWPHGYEESLRRAANRYNGGGALKWHYGGEVWHQSQSYIPIR